jgi:hypothetical protein
MGPIVLVLLLQCYMTIGRLTPRVVGSAYGRREERVMSTHQLVAFLVVVVLPTMVVEESLALRRRRRATRRKTAIRHYRRRLAFAADRAVAGALRRADPDGAVVVSVHEVQRLAYEDFGLASVSRDAAAAALRQRLDRSSRRRFVLSDADADPDLKRDWDPDADLDGDLDGDLDADRR